MQDAGGAAAEGEGGAAPGDMPPAIVIALVLMVGAGLVLGAVAIYAVGADRDTDGWVAQLARHGRPLLATAVSFAVSALMLAGFLDLARRAGPGGDGDLLRLGAAAIAVIAGASLAGIYMRYWWMPAAGSDLREAMESFWTWRARVACGAALVASGVLLIVGRRIAVVPALAVPFLIATVFAYPPRAVSELLSWTNPSTVDLWLGLAVDTGVDVGFAALCLAIVGALGRALPPSPVDRARAGAGLERVGAALIARVLVAVVGVFALVTTFGAQSIGLARVTAVAFPGALFVASVALVTGVLQAAGLATPGAPRRRLYVAAALILVGLVIEALKALAAYRGLSLMRGAGSFEAERLRATVEALPYLTPALWLAGLLCLLSAVARVRRDAPDAHVDEATISAAATAVTVFTVGAVALQRWAQTGGVKSVGAFVVVSIIVAIANVIAQLAVARACHRVGEALRATPGLPTAVVTVGRTAT